MNKYILAACLACATAARLDAGSTPHAYTDTGAKAVSAIGGALYDNLEDKYRKKIAPELIHIEQLDTPVVTPLPRSQSSQAQAQVMVSSGYINLINRLAHAKAIDRIQPGYFGQYIQLLAGASSNSAPDPPNLADDRFWSDQVMSEQVSYFNEMLSLSVAISLSDEYLGYLDRYASRMMAGKLTPINEFLSSDEWEACVKKASLNSLNCGYGVKNATPLFEALESMSTRPAWAAFVVPKNVSPKKVREELVTYDGLYYKGGLK